MIRRLSFIACLLGVLWLPGAASAGTSHGGPYARVLGVLYIRGAGSGHGVGLSQYGADGYALHGVDYRAILAHYYTGTAIGRADATGAVRVLLATGTAAFSGAATAPGMKLRSDWTYTVKALPDGSLALVDPHDKAVGRFPAPLAVSGPEPLTLVGRGSFRGTLEFRPDGTGGVQTVDALGLDDYVRGVVSAEMPASWPAQALEAQAVAARTYALTTSVDGNGYTLYDDTRSQMYRGVRAETPSTNAAVAATRGQIVTYAGDAVATYFFSSSGGHTENVENVWSAAAPAPWLRGVPDPYDGAAADPYHRWTDSMSLSAAARRLGSLVRGQLVGIRVLRDGVSPRLVLAEVVGTRGRTRVSGSRLQGLFGLLSTYAAFTAITSTPGIGPGSGRDAVTRTGWLPSRLAAQALYGVGPAVQALLAGAPVGLHGWVFPGRAGALIAVQQRGGDGWHTVGHVRLRAGGTFSVRVHRLGLYRVVDRGLDGPAVSVG